MPASSVAPMFEGIACPYCFSPTGAMLKMTKKGTWYTRCRACFSTGFVNSAHGWRGFYVAALVASLGENQVAQIVENMPPPIEKAIRARIAEPARPPVEVSDG